MDSAGDAIAAANRRIQQEIDALPDFDDARFWVIVGADGHALSAETLVHVLRAYRRQGRDADVERAADSLLSRAYPIAEGIVRRTLLSRPQDRDDAVCDALAVMWKHIAENNPFWERNFLGALHAACISACRTYMARKRSGVAFSDLAHPEGGIDYDGRFRDEATAHAQEAVLGQLTYERALASLDPPLREIARLMAEEALTQRQIAARVGCTEKTVYNRLGKIREGLARFFEGEDDDGYI